MICSPSAAASRYVNEEVLTFKRLGRQADIFCLLVGGEPDASDRPESGLLEAFPPSLRFALGPDGEPSDERAEPLAADVRHGKDARTDAKLKLIAGILGIGFDDLKRREVRRRRRQRMQLAAAALALLLAVLGVWRAFLGESRIALAQRLAEESTELLDSEDVDLIERGVLLNLQALAQLDRRADDPAADGEAAQARFAVDQNLRQALSLFYTYATSPRSEMAGLSYEDSGWEIWTAEAVGFSADGRTLTAASAWGQYPNAAVQRWRLDTGASAPGM